LLDRRAFALGFRFIAAIFRLSEVDMESPETIEKCLSEDPRPPVLYLRPFQLDPMTFTDRRSFELYFYQAITEPLGSLITLGNPQTMFIH
jgi:hypothetical protein